MGFVEYNPVPWNKDIARSYLEQVVKSEDDGSINWVGFQEGYYL